MFFEFRQDIIGNLKQSSDSLGNRLFKDHLLSLSWESAFLRWKSKSFKIFSKRSKIIKFLERVCGLMIKTYLKDFELERIGRIGNSWFNFKRWDIFNFNSHFSTFILMSWCIEFEINSKNWLNNNREKFIFSRRLSKYIVFSVENLVVHLVFALRSIFLVAAAK